MLFNACTIALFCATGLVSPMHAIAQVQTQEDLPTHILKKKPDKLDFFYTKVAPTVLSAATTADVFTTVRGLDHPTVAYRPDGSVLTNYYVVETGWARYFGDRSPFAASTANVILNLGVMDLSHRLYLRGGRWRVAALALVLAKAGANFEGGIHNERYLAGIDSDVRRSTGYYTGAILWSFPQRSH
jgi:hypothetical protein